MVNTLTLAALLGGIYTHMLCPHFDSEKRVLGSVIIDNVVFCPVTLVGARTHNRLQQFSRFSLGVEPRTPGAEAAPPTTGQFQLFADTISAFDEDCINTVKEADDLPKTEVQVMWKAPKEGSGCVVIK